MGRTLGIFVQFLVKLWRNRQRGSAQPEEEHQPDEQDSAQAARTICLHAHLHLRVIELQRQHNASHFFGKLGPDSMLRTFLIEVPPSAIPKGWNHSAQGCEERATLGQTNKQPINPERVAARSSWRSSAAIGAYVFIDSN